MYPTYPATLEVSGARLVRAPARDRTCDPTSRRSRSSITRAHARDRLGESQQSERPHASTRRSSPSSASWRAGTSCGWWWTRSTRAWRPAGGCRGSRARLPEQVVTLGSLSKSHAMTGWRAGWLVGPRELAANAELLAMCMLFGLPGFVQEAAITALEVAPEAERARMREYCRLPPAALRGAASAGSRGCGSSSRKRACSC